jgi:protein O-GlcNAc transferase
MCSYERALALCPGNPRYLYNIGLILFDQRSFERAKAYFQECLDISPNFPEAHNNLCACLLSLQDPVGALSHADRAIMLRPDHAEAWSNRASALRDLRRLTEALASYDRFIELKSDSAEAWLNRGVVLSDLGRHNEALVNYERSIELKSDVIYGLGYLVHTQLKICDWASLDLRRETLQDRILTGNLASHPFSILGLFDDLHLQRQCAELYAKKMFSFEPETKPFTKKSTRDSKKKIRIGYFSADFHNHATMYLMVQLFEYHDRDQFEVFGFSFGPSKNDAMRDRARNNLNYFFEIATLSDADIASLSRSNGIDIAVDLKGYTQDSRPAIFAHRAAPIQISYLGFPGTTGSSAVDYLIADPVLIPVTSQSAYSERIIYLPDSYQVNDSHRAMSRRVFSRRELGLPESGFVFCCFNNNWKILPEIFGAWVRILQAVPNSSLWLYEENATAAHNLRAEAARRHVDPNRLVFARHQPHAEHLARYRAADLFLDTFPCGAHTTASDALWAGIPVLTRSGESFASRVASSLLNAVGLPELITHAADQYEALAIEVANNPGRAASLKAKLAENLPTCPLFNTALFTRHIESAYQAAYDRYRNDLGPDHIFVN